MAGNMCGSPRDATHYAWTTHMFLYQSQMRNLKGTKNTTGGGPAPALYPLYNFILSKFFGGGRGVGVFFIWSL